MTYVKYCTKAMQPAVVSWIMEPLFYMFDSSKIAGGR